MQYADVASLHCLSYLARRASTLPVLVVLTEHGREKLKAARPIHAASVRRNLLDRLTAEQTATMVRVSNILGEDEKKIGPPTRTVCWGNE